MPLNNFSHAVFMIIPAIIPVSLTELKATLEMVSFAPRFQIDVVDGRLVPFTSWPYEPKGNPKEATELLTNYAVEIDLMVENAVEAGREWLQAGAKGLVFHIESLEDPKEALALADEFSFDLGFSISNDTPIESLYLYIQSLDFVQIMGIDKIGQQGQPFDNRALDRIAEIASLYPEIIISVDGGVNESTLKSLRDVGAKRFVSGSAILKAADPKAKYLELLKIIA